LVEALAPGAALPGAALERISREARGNPLLAHELAHFALARDTDASTDALTFSALIAARLSSLTHAERELLDLVTLLGEPVPIDVALTASRADHACIQRLHAARLLRSTVQHKQHGHGLACLEPYHDRVREAIAGEVSEARARNIAATLVATLSRQTEPQHHLLSRCCELAGEHQAAAQHAIAAAQHAESALAFEQAVELYGLALRLGTWVELMQAQLTGSLGLALEYAGHSTLAADAYMRAAALSAGPTSLDFKRRAAQQLLFTGHYADGVRIMQEVAQESRIPMPRSTAKAVATFAFNALQIRYRGLAPRVRSGEHYDAALLKTAHAAVGTAFYQPLQAASAVSHYLRVVLDAQVSGGALATRHELRWHLTRALGYNALIHSTIAAKSPWAAALLARMNAVIGEDDSADNRGFGALVKGVTAYHWDHLREARGYLSRALEALRECTGVGWELDLSMLYDQLSACLCGDFADVVRTTPNLIDESFRRGRIWVGAMLTGGSGTITWLTPDDTQGCRKRLNEARRRWVTPDNFHWPDYFFIISELMLCLYEGDAARGLDLLSTRLASFNESQVARAAFTRRALAWYRSCCAASLLRQSQRGKASEDARYRALIRASAKQVPGAAPGCDAVLALADGDPERAADLLRSALKHSEGSGRLMYAAAGRRRLGQLLGGDEGSALVAQAEAYMTAQGVKNIEAMTMLLSPGFERL
jgi:hypothetical protein